MVLSVRLHPSYSRSVSALASFLLALVGIHICLPFSSAWVTFTSPDGSRDFTTYPSYDFEGFTEPYYNVASVLLPVVIHSQCTLATVTSLSFDLAHLKLDTHIVNSTALVVVRENMLEAGCNSYDKVFTRIPNIIKGLEKIGYPPVTVLLLGAELNNDQYFGNSKVEDFYDYESVKPEGVHPALIGRDIATELWNRVRDSGPMAIQIEQDPGYWNVYRSSALEIAHTVARYVLFVPLIGAGIYYTIIIVRSNRTLIDSRVGILISAVIFAFGSIIAPIGISKTRVEDIVRYISWIALYTCYFWMILKWTYIIRKIQNPRFANVFYYYTMSICGFTYVYCLLNLVLVFYDNIVITRMKRVMINYMFPPLYGVQGVALFVYGYLFLRYVFKGFIFESLQDALAKLTRLCYGTFMSLSLISFCSALNNDQWTSTPWVVIVRAGTQNFASFLLTCLVIWALRIHDSPALTPQEMSKAHVTCATSHTDIGTSGTNHSGHKSNYLPSSTVHINMPSHSLAFPPRIVTPRSSARVSRNPMFRNNHPFSILMRSNHSLAAVAASIPSNGRLSPH
ncbi:hypothetical protein BJ085DRAFT_34372 [Dimargaris cristalligena]|uniref:Uncharacterized protein n=1 Tax=Dimargaris cristalligena TaxID=215637 RepID=A0A4Q0A2M2_9FUNG|nr:hypothetical protein BJ085DRAFT_34372 [Dimargaris cristalligena]|eukprot:RKP39430.1 hypothetical protein BJ085DRAFT_34372 [Dimargaris cristalligena]